MLAAIAKSDASFFLMIHLPFRVAGGRIDGGVSLGQYRRIAVD
jgi:hypothetical protein